MVSTLPVKPERSGWRDLRLSQRHRTWGWNCPAVDIDFLSLEYDKGQPTAIVEYKHEKAPPQYASQPNYQALINLGNRATLPVFAVRYTDDFEWWEVVPLNELAKEWCPVRKQMTEVDWVKLLYHMRGFDPPQDLFDGRSVVV